MALTLENINLVVQKTYPDSRWPGVAENLRALWKHMQQLRNPDLKIKMISGLQTADVVVSDSPCKLFAVFIKKPAASTTNAWAKGSDHATVAAANGDFVTFLVGTSGGGREYCPVYADGLPMTTGFTVGSHTTVNGNTKSAAADAWTGFAIVGAP
jgi:hypothetical protein